MRFAGDIGTAATGRPDKTLRLLWALAGILLVASLVSWVLVLRLGPEPRYDAPISQAPAIDPADRIRFTNALGKQLQALSSFDTPIGGKMGDVVPIAELSEKERACLRLGWEQVLQPRFCPSESTKVQWRKVLWSQVPWAEPRQGRKDPTPPKYDVCVASWMVDKLRVRVRGSGLPGRTAVGVTLYLVGDSKVPFSYPTLGELADAPHGRAIVHRIDKTALLSVLTTVLRFPWQTVDDFVVTCTISPTSPGHLRIEASHPPTPGRPREWFEEVPLSIRGDDPQRLSVGWLRVNVPIDGE